MRRVLIFLIIFLISFSCEKLSESELILGAEIVSIEYGTSFGECTGYCNVSISITENSINYIASSNSDNYQNISKDFTIDKEVWEDLKDKVDFIIFRNLDEVVGCPDCNDGGAEWLSISTNLLSHKVTFEFHNSPEEINDIIIELRKILLAYS